MQLSRIMTCPAQSIEVSSLKLFPSLAACNKISHGSYWITSQFHQPTCFQVRRGTCLLNHLLIEYSHTIIAGANNKSPMTEWKYFWSPKLVLLVLPEVSTGRWNEQPKGPSPGFRGFNFYLKWTQLWSEPFLIVSWSRWQKKRPSPTQLQHNRWQAGKRRGDDMLRLIQLIVCSNNLEGCYSGKMWFGSCSWVLKYSYVLEGLGFRRTSLGRISLHSLEGLGMNRIWS